MSQNISRLTSSELTTLVPTYFRTFWENVKYGGKINFQLDYGNVRNLIARPGVFGAIVHEFAGFLRI